MAKYFYQHFQIFSTFIYNESLPMKSYQFFRMYKHFDMEREKNTYAAVSEKKLRKVELCFITGCFIKSFSMIINHFCCSANAFAVQFLPCGIRIIRNITKTLAGRLLQRAHLCTQLSRERQQTLRHQPGDYCREFTSAHS